MFSTSDSKVTTAVCVVAMMMMMMMAMTMTTAEAAAMPKGGGHYRHQAKTHRKSSDEMVPLQLDPNALVSAKIIRPLQNVSISPWTYNETYDESLFPPTVSEARCLLQGCLDLEGQENLTLESRPIMREVLLLRRVRSAGAGAGSAADGYHYRLESRLIAVGCTCVRPNIQRQQ